MENTFGKYTAQIDEVTSVLEELEVHLKATAEAKEKQYAENRLMNGEDSEGNCQCAMKRELETKPTIHIDTVIISDKEECPCGELEEAEDYIEELEDIVDAQDYIIQALAKESERLKAIVSHADTAISIRDTQIRLLNKILVIEGMEVFKI